MNKPTIKPENPYFSSGPTHKPVELITHPLLGRSHRSKITKKILEEVINRQRHLLKLPDDYLLAIIPGSATGAMECALWSLLGINPVDIFTFDVFSDLWSKDVEEELKLKDIRVFSAPYGNLPDLSLCDNSHDVVFSWCGTTSGVIVPDANWISDNRVGLTICDATSAAFCIDLPWDKLDAVAFSWAKGLGGEAAHGMLALSPKAVQRLETYIPDRPIPRLFRIAQHGKLNTGIFAGLTINTPSILCLIDLLNCLDWAESVISLADRCTQNFNIIKEWVNKVDWINFMAKDLSFTSPTAVCLVIKPWQNLRQDQHRQLLTQMADMLGEEEVGYDFINHILAHPSLRIWCGPTVDYQDIKKLLPWLEWAYNKLSISI